VGISIKSFALSIYILLNLIWFLNAFIICHWICLNTAYDFDFEKSSNFHVLWSQISSNVEEFSYGGVMCLSNVAFLFLMKNIFIPSTLKNSRGRICFERKVSLDEYWAEIPSLCQTLLTIITWLQILQDVGNLSFQHLLFTSITFYDHF